MLIFRVLFWPKSCIIGLEEYSLADRDVLARWFENEGVLLLEKKFLPHSSENVQKLVGVNDSNLKLIEEGYEVILLTWVVRSRLLDLKSRWRPSCGF